jgi:hypothetical protein
MEIVKFIYKFVGQAKTNDSTCLEIGLTTKLSKIVAYLSFMFEETVD